MRTLHFAPALVCLAVIAAGARAQPADAPGETQLRDLLAAIGEREGRRFLVDRRMPDTVVVGTADPDALDYAALLGVLRNNGLAVVEIGGYANVVPAGEVRQYPLPLVDRRDADLPDDAWVTRVIDVADDLEAAMLVPVLRPLLPREAHLAAIATENKLVVVDRLGNVRRIEAIIDAMR